MESRSEEMNDKWEQLRDAGLSEPLTSWNDPCQEKLPTPWFKTEQIETWIGEPISTEGKEISELNGGRGKLIVIHQCGENKEELISQLNTLIHGLKEGFDWFAT